jgi:GTP 3',8-cyclase
MKMLDSFGRSINYLRISVTDRCNYRCVYCMPEEGVPLHSHTQILTYEEIADVVRTAAENGISRIRITGGEPLIRRDLPRLIRALKLIPGIIEISLSTNGSLLSQFASSLSDAGLDRVNVSLDTLRPDRFEKITRKGKIESVWEGIASAEKAGLNPIKVNVVVIRGFNEDELIDFTRLAFIHPWQVRFIELMPLESFDSWGSNFIGESKRYFSVQEMQELLGELNLQPVEGDIGNGPARIFKQIGASGTIGFISPLGDHFCDTCNRLRLTADGRLRPCLLNNYEIPIRDALRSGENIASYLLKAINSKPREHDLCKNFTPLKRKMSQIGG